MEATYPWDGALPDAVVTLSHRKREVLARWLNEAHRPPNATLIRRDPSKELTGGAIMRPSEEMYVWPEMLLLGCARSSHGKIRNGVVYVVQEVQAETVSVKMFAPNSPVIALSHHDLLQTTRIEAARTHASVQGMTLRKADGSGRRLLILDASHQYCTGRTLYVSLSRVISGRLCHVATREQTTVLLERISRGRQGALPGSD